MITDFTHINKCLIESLGGVKNIVTYNEHDGDIYILIRSIKMLPSRIANFDYYWYIWINDNLLNLKVTFDTRAWIKEFKKSFLHQTF